MEIAESMKVDPEQTVSASGSRLLARSPCMALLLLAVSCGARSDLEHWLGDATASTPSDGGACAVASCDGMCTDLALDPGHCGACGLRCLGRANATPTCTAGRCDLRCDGGFHRCGDACVSDGAAATCGGACTPCPTPAHGNSVCAAGRCAVTCDLGWSAFGDGCEPAPPRLLAPRSTSTVYTSQPTFRSTRALAADATEIELCADRPCTHVLARERSTGSNVRFSTPLAPGVFFFRARSVRSGVASPVASPTWEAFVHPSSPPRDVSWGRTLDVDGDGLADAAMGSWNAPLVSSSRLSAGAMYVFAHVGGALSASPTQVFRAARDGDYFGAEVVAAGDVDGDGFGDVLVKTYGTEHSASLYFGGPSGLKSTPLTLVRPTDSRGFVDRIAGLGDVNGDGYADLVASDYADASPTARPGRLYVYFGGPDGPRSGPDQTLYGDATDQWFGNQPAGVGDLNGDGFEDMVVGSAYSDRPRGHASVFFGGPSGFRPTADAVVPPPTGSTNFGAPLGAAGDVNGDGLADFVAGAYWSTSPGGAWVFFGSTDVTRIGRATSLTPTSETGCGSAVAGAGDLDGDGYAEVVVGCPLQGEARVFRGGSSGPDPSHPIHVAAPAPVIAHFGAQVAGLGDADGDGISDLLVCARGDWNNSASYLFQGTRGAIGSVAPTVLRTGDPGGDTTVYASSTGP
jgi:hypothetical protein